MRLVYGEPIGLRVSDCLSSTYENKLGSSHHFVILIVSQSEGWVTRCHSLYNS